MNVNAKNLSQTKNRKGYGLLLHLFDYGIFFRIYLKIPFNIVEE